MGKIRKIKEKDLVNGVGEIDVYPITSTLAVYDQQNKKLDDILNDLKNNKQDKLVGTPGETQNIKTVNGENILGSGNIQIDSGVANYNDIANKPKINSIELSGNKTASDLNLQPKGNYALETDLNTKQNTLISGENIKTINGEDILGTGNIEIKTTPSIDVVDNLSSSSKTDALSANQGKILKQDIDAKQNTLVSGENIKTVNGENILGPGNIQIDKGITNYNDITNKPKINSIELSGNKTASDLKLQPEGDYALKTDLNTKQNTLVSGENIKTVNGYDITGSGNIEISKGLTEEEYRNLPVKNPKTLYCIIG